MDQARQGPYLAEDLEALLDTTESELLTALSGYPELAPLADYLRDRFADARQELGLGAVATPAIDRRQSYLPRVVPAHLSRASRASSLAVPARQATEDRGQADGVLASIYSFLQKLTGAARTNRLAIDRICVMSFPTEKATVRMWAESRPQSSERATETNNWIRTVWQSKYHYRFFLDPAIPHSCPDPQTATTENCILLDLWDNTGPLVECDVATGNCVSTSGSTAACEP